MKQTIDQNIQPVVYKNETYPLTFAYVIAQSSVINSNNTSGGVLIAGTNSCSPRGLAIRTPGPTVSVTKTISALNRNGTTVTATSTAHGLSNGTSVTISGASPTIFNGSFNITVTGPNTFTYSVSTSGNDSASGNMSLSATTTTFSNVPLDKDRLVWITGVGAYVTKEGAWVPVPEVTNIINNSTKIYTTNEKGSYLVFDTRNITDPFNQVKQLKANEGYLVVSNKAGQIPDYVWYEEIHQRISEDLPSASFVYNLSALSTLEVSNNQKVVRLIDIEGACDSHKSAGATLKIRMKNLKKGYNYRLSFDSDHPNLVFENNELYYGNNQISEFTVNNNIDILSNLINNIVSINLSLYENENLFCVDTVGIYVNCPPKPVSEPPPLVKPKFYLIGE